MEKARGKYYENFIKKILEKSSSKNWEKAVTEWVCCGCDEDETQSQSCICGKEELFYLFSLKNQLNGNTLYPIGSKCIKKFNRDDLNEEVSTTIAFFKLLHAVEKNKFIELNANFFSKKLIKKLLDLQAFTSNNFNANKPENDYNFMIKMFNKRNKNDITDNQRSKINAIIICSIKPFLENYKKLFSNKNSIAKQTL